MRLSVLVSALVFALGLGYAAPAPAQPAPNASHMEHARDMAQLLLVESDIVGTGVEAAFGVLGPQLRQSMLAGEFYNSLRPDTQRSLTAFVDGFPAMLRSEIGAEMPVIAEEFAQGVAPLFTDGELSEIVGFLGQPQVRAAYLRAVAAGAQSAAGGGTQVSPEMNPEETAAFEAFALTPGERALDAQSRQMMVLLQQALASGSARMMPRIQSRVMRDMCAALGDECPPHIRAAAGQPVA